MAEAVDPQGEGRVTLTLIETVALEDVRNAAGWRQEDVAARCGVEQPTISRLEGGSWPRTRKRVQLYADAYGLTERDFLAALLAQHDRCAARDSNPEPAVSAALKLRFQRRFSTGFDPSAMVRTGSARAA